MLSPMAGLNFWTHANRIAVIFQRNNVEKAACHSMY